MNITSRQLKAFLLTARHHSFSRAAEQLFITQSGMSVLVRELEAQLGFRLFDRTTRRVTLTEFGTRFLPVADRSVLELEAAASNIGRSASAANHRLVIGATPFIAANLLPAAIAQYAKLHPELQIRLHDAERPQLLAMLESGEIDVGLSADVHPAPGLQHLPLMRFSLMAVLPEHDAQGLPARLRWADVAARRLVGLKPRNTIQELVDHQLQRLGRSQPPEVVCTYSETQIAMVEAGAGAAVLPSFALPACRKRRVATRPLTEPVVLGDLYWIVSRGRKLPEGADGFTKFLNASIAESAGPASGAI
jgi:DNA-binding transcriptional LysR family regulator